MGNKTIIKDIVYSFEGVEFNPILNKNVILVESKWIGHYTRKSTKPPYGEINQLLVVDVSDEAPGLQKLNSKEEVDAFLEKYWIEILNQALYGINKDLVNLARGSITVPEPKWWTLEELKKDWGLTDKDSVKIDMPYSYKEKKE